MPQSRVDELRWRGLVQDTTDDAAITALRETHSFYVGYDPTASSLQVGNLIPIIVSIHLARSGLRAIQLFGGATGAIGDPSGKSMERPLLDRDTISRNVQNHQRLVTGIFERAGVTAEFVDNYDWTQKLSVIDFLRDIGKHFTVNYMIQKEVVKARLEGEGLSFTEFSYMLLQANDYYQLYRSHECRLQIGGSDQWGNITAGLELIRKKGLGEAHALSIPLLTDSHGKKFGKSEGGTLWLDPSQTSPYKFHQFWLNVEDADVIRYVKVFTFLSQEEITELEEATRAHPERREAQRRLADEVCTIVHGADATALAKKSAEVLFGGSTQGLADDQLLQIFADVPSSQLQISQASAPIIDIFVSSGLAKSKGEARRLMANGGAYVNNERVDDGEKALSAYLTATSRILVLRSGKKNYHLLKLID